MKEKRKRKRPANVRKEFSDFYTVDEIDEARNFLIGERDKRLFNMDETDNAKFALITSHIIAMLALLKHYEENFQETV